MLNLLRLRVLQAVAQEGSFSSAARTLDYTQPAVSHHVARLENEVGTPLVLRTGRGVRLTPAGQALVEHADAVLTRVATAEAEIAEIAGMRGGRVRLAAFPSASATVVPRAVRALRDKHPALTVSLVDAEPPEALALVKGGEIDCALVFSYPEAAIASGGDLQVRTLFGDELFVVLPAHRGSRQRSVDLGQLCDETWIAGCERCRAHLLHLSARAGFDPQIDYATDDYVTVQALVAAGLGVALLPGLALAAARRDDIVTLPLAEPATREIAAVLPAGARQPPAVAAMLGVLQAVEPVRS